MVSRHPNVYRRTYVLVRQCQILFMRYFLQFFPNGFQILRYGDHGQGVELKLTFRDYGPIFKVTGVIMFQN